MAVVSLRVLKNGDVAPEIQAAAGVPADRG